MGTFGDFERIECKQIGSRNQTLLKGRYQMRVLLGREIREDVEKVCHEYGELRGSICDVFQETRFFQPRRIA